MEWVKKKNNNNNQLVTQVARSNFVYNSQVGIYLLKVSNRNTEARYEIC